MVKRCWTNETARHHSSTVLLLLSCNQSQLVFPFGVEQFFLQKPVMVMPVHTDFTMHKSILLDLTCSESQSLSSLAKHFDNFQNGCLGIRLFAFGGAYWPLATAHSNPLWVQTCFGCVNRAPG